jgi:O-antigen ligase
MVRMVYAQNRDAQAIQQLNSHLHNVPLQIAAERGIPALVVWLWFMYTLLHDFVRRKRTTAFPSVAMAAVASTVALLAAGLFEYNFGDSEFLMLFLVIVTLPYAADRGASATPQRAA